MVKEVEVLIVGGGPAGLACARALAGRGVRPVVLERRHWPVDKVCGEGLMPAGRAILARLGVTAVGQPFTGIEYIRGSCRAGADFAEGPGLAVRRLELSSALLCPEAAELVEGCLVRSARPAGDWMEVDTNHGLWRCRLLVAADGLHSPLRHAFGLNRPTPGWLRRWGWRRHFATPPWNQRVEVHYADGCEAYVSPVGTNQVGVAVLSGKGLQRSNWLDAFPELAARLQEPLSDLSGLGPLWQRARQVHQPGLVLLGDAAGYLDACTGEGLTLALAQAELLAREWRPGCRYFPAYARGYAGIVNHYYAVTFAALALAHWPRLSLATLRVLAEHPRLFQSLLSANQGLRSPLGPLLQLMLRVPRKLFAG